MSSRRSPPQALPQAPPGSHSTALPAPWLVSIQADCRLSLLERRYWHRLVATAGGWFLWDFSFYGNKVFQSTFIGILSPGASLFTNLLWTLLNSGAPPPHLLPTPRTPASTGRCLPACAHAQPLDGAQASP